MVITRVARKLCAVDTVDISKMFLPKQCQNFRVLSPEYCYAIAWPDYMQFFEEKYANATMERLNHSVIAHVWNKHSASHLLSLDSDVAYIRLAKKFCPKVFRASEFF